MFIASDGNFVVDTMAEQDMPNLTASNSAQTAFRSRGGKSPLPRTPQGASGPCNAFVLKLRKADLVENALAPLPADKVSEPLSIWSRINPSQATQDPR
ncbi:hypothetical protein KIP88_41035 [Bradyrhizobium sp. SRL28]|uniref:hypothetical protein n=1 Tax=Bradyrhizobium sp. SRL28 TaxID=2836178 RepID=UPI001BDDE8FB|nr:hypothetical protein [Bradyrhizobium sp. SRL28]MBT1516793.1 hypothetical protein [Bradyrhizobium sp. SRL28]